MPVVFPHIGSRGERHIDDWVSSAKDEVCPEEIAATSCYLLYLGGRQPQHFRTASQLPISQNTTYGYGK